jgi:hypothetical protein
MPTLTQSSNQDHGTPDRPSSSSTPIHRNTHQSSYQNTRRCFVQRKTNTEVQIKPHPTRHVWLPWRAGMDQLESLFLFPPTQRVSESLVFPAPLCQDGRNGSVCTDNQGSFTCACMDDGYASTGSTYKTCQLEKAGSDRFFPSEELQETIACPAGAVYDGAGKNITACRCPAGQYGDWSKHTNDTLSASLQCRDCPAGTWSYAGATQCNPCWEHSWSLPGAFHPYMCLCDAGYASDWTPGAGGSATDVSCEVDVTTCDAEEGTCSVATEVRRGEMDCKDLAKCRVKRGTRENPCIKCPANAVSEAGSRSIWNCTCKEVPSSVPVHLSISVHLSVHLFVYLSACLHGF